MLLSGCALLQAPNLDPAEGVLFYDDFSRFYSGWDIQKGEEGATRYQDGKYLIRVEEENLDLWGNPGLDLEDVSIEVDAVRTAGPAGNTFGIICRYRNAENFYFGIVTSDNYYAIGERISGGVGLLGGEELSFTNKVKGGSEVNHLRFDCVGSTLSLYANGTLLARVEGAVRESGDVGLIAGTLEEPGVEINFDDFVVFEP